MDSLTIKILRSIPAENLEDGDTIVIVLIVEFIIEVFLDAVVPNFVVVVGEVVHTLVLKLIREPELSTNVFRVQDDAISGHGSRSDNRSRVRERSGFGKLLLQGVDVTFVLGSLDATLQWCLEEVPRRLHFTRLLVLVHAGHVGHREQVLRLLVVDQEFDGQGG